MFDEEDFQMAKASTALAGFTKAICVGRNYAAHVAEMGAKSTKTPVLFMKPRSALRFPAEGDSLTLPRGHGSVHHEVELALVVGKAIPLGSTAADVADSISGVCVALDMTLRDAQWEAKDAGKPWTVAKAFDGSLPVSEVVSAAGIDFGALSIFCEVDGVEKQRGQTSDMLHQVPELLEHIATFFSLEEGDLVLTGTPEGVGPVEPGQRVRAGIEGVVELDVTFE